MNLGPVGLFLVAIVDSSVVPLPIPGSTDLLLLLFASQDGDPWLFAVAAVAGSMVGGYSAWLMGKRGGEAAMNRFVSRRLRDRIRSWVERHPILAVFLPAVLPPPIPLSPFLLASGALGVSRGRFLFVFAVARSFRYGLICWLAVSYGRHVVRLWNRTLRAWSTPLICVFVAVLVCGIAYAIWKIRRPANPAPGQNSTVEAKTASAR
jgi:membrane protein YqaA with SNARE-associated domain